MAILVDLNQIVYSTISIKPDKKVPLDVDIVRHITLNRLRLFRNKFKSKYGELIICCDSRRYWRREVFPNYKVTRKAQRESTNLPWEVIFEALAAIKSELRDSFPYKIIEVEGAEADDLIAILSKYIKEDIVIVSGDKDFLQLQSPKVKQWDPTKKKFVQSENIEDYMLNHILRGDKGDSVPNVKSPDDFFLTKQYAPKITKSFVRDFDLSTCGQELSRNYYRNKQLIDLTAIPEEIKLSIINEYEKMIPANRAKLFPYFIKHKLKYLMEAIAEF
jgi:hypothetical protein